MNGDEIFNLSVDIATQIIKCGGEIHRAEDTLKRINKAYGHDCTVFALPSLIIAQSENNLQIRRIEREDTDLAELERLNALSRRLCYDYDEEIRVTRKKLYPKFMEIIAICSATSAFCIFFGGTLLDSLFSAIIGVVITQSGYKSIVLPIFSSNLIDSFIAGVLANIPILIGINIHPDKTIIGTIMLLVPGLTVVNAARDMMGGDLIAGLIQLFSAIISALGIAFGTAGAILLFSVI